MHLRVACVIKRQTFPSPQATLFRMAYTFLERCRATSPLRHRNILTEKALEVAFTVTMTEVGNF